MSATVASSITLALADYQKLWMGAAREVLEQISGSPFEGHLGSPAPAPSLSPAAPCFVFSVGAPLGGEQCVSISAAGGLLLSQLLVGEAPDAMATFDGDHRDALAELFRQIAGSAATALRAATEQEIEMKFAGDERPAWQPASPGGFRMTLSSARCPAVEVDVYLSSELGHVLRADQPPAESSVRREDAGASCYEPNLEFLRDVELTVTLRFGRRNMLLREVLEIVPGAVVELEQQVDEPVELLVGKKVIARGDVVVVEGNYGLRVTEVLSPVERVQSLRA